MKKLADYKMDLYPQFTPSILAAMDHNNIQLKTAQLCLKDAQRAEQQFSLLQSSRSTQAIEELRISTAFNNKN
jgi:hypothetical protein